MLFRTPTHRAVGPYTTGVVSSVLYLRCAACSLCARPKGYHPGWELNRPPSCGRWDGCRRAALLPIPCCRFRTDCRPLIPHPEPAQDGVRRSTQRTQGARLHQISATTLRSMPNTCLPGPAFRTCSPRTPAVMSRRGVRKETVRHNGKRVTLYSCHAKGVHHVYSIQDLNYSTPA